MAVAAEDSLAVLQEETDHARRSIPARAPFSTGCWHGLAAVQRGGNEPGSDQVRQTTLPKETAEANSKTFRFQFCSVK